MSNTGSVGAIVTGISFVWELTERYEAAAKRDQEERAGRDAYFCRLFPADDLRVKMVGPPRLYEACCRLEIYVEKGSDLQVWEWKIASSDRGASADRGLLLRRVKYAFDGAEIRRALGRVSAPDAATLAEQITALAKQRDEAKAILDRIRSATDDGLYPEPDVAKHVERLVREEKYYREQHEAACMALGCIGFIGRDRWGACADDIKKRIDLETTRADEAEDWLRKAHERHADAERDLMGELWELRRRTLLGSTGRIRSWIRSWI